jgi:hypothetical protein
MATLAAGDVTTQLSKWIAANATAGDVNTKMRAALATATGLPATKDVTMLLLKFIAR